MQRILITGANRGIGLALVEEYLSRGDVQIFATCRNPDDAEALQKLAQSDSSNLEIVQLEVTDPESIKAVFTEITAKTTVLDIVVNNAGIDPPGQSFEQIDAELMLQVFKVNTVAPMMISQSALPFLINSNNARLIHISTSMASLQNRTYGGNYGYCSSKSALNMAMRGMAVDLRQYKIIVVALDPGWVQTDMGGQSASLTPEESAQGLVTVIDALKSTDNGRYLVYDGSEHPW
jgi:NAD(P)-dependent dehydrogenase (short-subunit alcohol dehydrogenase family)